MNTSNRILKPILFGVIGLGSLVALSACSQPNVDNTTTAPVGETTTTTNEPVAESPTTISPSSGATTEQNLADLAQSAASSGSFTILTQAVQAAGLTENLSGADSYTVFAPTDAAFDALPEGTVENLLKPENKQQLVQLLSYHVIPGEVTSTQLTSGQVKTVQGTPVTVNVDSASNTVTVNDAKVIQADIPASNGVVHVVDKVILPPNVQARLTSNQPAQ